MRIVSSRFAFPLLFVTCISSVIADPKVGLLVKAQDSSFWKAVDKGADEEARKLGVDLVVRAPLEETDISVQIRLLNALAAQGAQAIILAPINKQALAIPVASIAVKGVKFVIIDTQLGGRAAPVFVGTDQIAAGREAGKLLASLVGDHDEVSIFRHQQTAGATTDRETGALATFRAARPNAIVHGEIYASAQPGAEEAQAQLLLKTHPNIKAVLASGTPGTLGMLHVLEKDNLAGKIKLVGFGFNLTPEVDKAIDDGAMSGWIAQLPVEVGIKGVDAAVKILKGETVPAVVNTDFVVITKENLQDPKVQALLKL